MRRILFALGAAVFFTLSPAARSQVVIGPQLAIDPGVSQGELLFSELNCAACHATRAPGARQPPILGKTGLQITPQSLRKYLSDPAGHKPGTTMPDMLRQFEGTKKAEAVESLVHYLVSLQDQPNTPGTGAEDYLIRQGRALYHTVGCVACHAPQASPDAVPGLTSEDPKLEEFDPSLRGPASVPLGDLARKTTVEQLAKFLLDPLKTRPSGRMPSLNLTGGEATSIAVYLLRDQAAGLKDPSKRALISGLKYQYYEEDFGPDPQFETFTPKASGTVSGFEIAQRRRDNSFGFRYSGSINIPKDGRYAFFVESDDGAKLYVDGQLVVDNGGDHAPQEKRGTIELKAGEHGILATYFNNGAGFEFKVAWRPPGGKKEAIPPNLLAHYGQPMIPTGQTEFVLDSQKAAAGRTLFNQAGCSACHIVVEGQMTMRSKTRPLPIQKPDAGCLAEDPNPSVPRFAFSPEQRAALRQTVAKRADRNPKLAPAEQVSHTLAQLNCFACHTREGKGGPVDPRLAYFRTAGEIDMGDEGRIPPHLTKVGGKLRSQWMQEVLLNRGRARPYMATRMPQFGAENVGHLPDVFEQADLANKTLPEPEGSLRDAKFGRRLVGQGGLSCISCHTFANHKSLGIPALDMALMTKRLKFDWFHRYVIDPPSLRPGTRMPSFWPGGEAVNKDILGGKTDAQIDAIWAYLASHPDNDLPPGLIQGRQEIVATTEPVIYRNFIAGAGPRAIGVGYPEKVNLAFDANNLRLAMIWQGPFIDAARHSSGRGEGFEPPLGNNVVNLPEGPEFAILPNSESAWPTTGGKQAGFRMGGYSLDERRRPTFVYEFNGIKVEESFEPVMGEIDAYFKRSLRLSGDLKDNMWFRAAVGNIEEKGGNFVMNGKITMKFPGARPLLRASGSQRELLVPVRSNGPEAMIVEEIIW